MEKGIRYHRFSSNDQSHHSIERQELVTDHWMTYNKVITVDTFKDEGYTARNFDRPDIKLLFEFIRKNHHGIDYLVVADLIRFSREAGDAINMVKKIQASYGIRIVSAGRGNIYDCLDHNSFFMMGLEFLLGNSENIKRQNDINGGIYAAKAVKGRWIQGGPAPYGYTKEGEGEDRRLVINEEQAAMIRYIYEAYLAGTPPYIIYETAKSRSFPRKSHSAITEILNNPLYTGFQKVKPWKNSPGGLFEIKNLQAIIDVSDWNQVQEKMYRPEKPRVAVSENFPLRGVLKCHCKKMLTGAPSRGRRGKYYDYYKCQVSGHNTIPAPKAHDQLNEVLQLMSLPEDLVVAIREQSAQLLEEKTFADKKILQKKKREFAQLEEQLRSVEEKWINNQMNHDTYNRWHEEICRKRIAVDADIRKLTRDENDIYFLLQENLDKLTDLKAVYQSAALLQKQELLRKVFDNSLYYKDSVYRTPFVMPVFAHNLLILNQKQLLVLDGTEGKSGEVEATGFEPVSKHILQKLSTCLFPYCLSEKCRNETHQHFS